MIAVINPITSRLGVSRFSVTNYLPIIKSNYTLLDKYNYQNYIGSLEVFCRIYFHSRFKIYFYTRLYTLFSGIKFNTYGFPGTLNQIKYTSMQKFVLNLKFYDFYMHVYGGSSLRVIVDKYIEPLITKSMYYVRKAQKRLRSKRVNNKKLIPNQQKGYIQSMFRYNSQIKTVISFIKRFVWCLNIFKLHVKNYLLRLKLFLQYTNFKVRLYRLHNHFFSGIPLLCKINIVPFQGRVTARFICFFIERRVRSGMYLPKVVGLVFRFLKRTKTVRGLRILCSGRFKRGNKAGYYRRIRGSCTFGSIDTFHDKYEMDYSELKINLRAGTCGIRVWVCFWSKRLTHLFYKQIASPYGFTNRRRRLISRRRRSRRNYRFPILGH